MLAWALSIACVVANVVAVAAVVLGRRSDRPQRYALRAALAALATIAAAPIGYFVGLAQAFASVAHADASEKSALLAAGISEAMNTVAFAALAAVVPLGATIYLLVAAPRERRPSEGG